MFFGGNSAHYAFCPQAVGESDLFLLISQPEILHSNGFVGLQMEMSPSMCAL
jgi:hypothetical protein